MFTLTLYNFFLEAQGGSLARPCYTNNKESLKLKWYLCDGALVGSQTFYGPL